MKIFQTPSYDRFCLFEMERKSKDFRGMDGNVAYKNKQIDNVEISNEGRRALRKSFENSSSCGCQSVKTEKPAMSAKVALLSTSSAHSTSLSLMPPAIMV